MNSEKTRKRGNRAYAYAIAAAIILFVLVAPEHIESNSMDPTLSKGQVIIMKKEGYSAKRGAPELGNVVVLEKTIGKKLSEDNIVGRVVGLPEDKVEIKDGKFYRNGKEYNVKSSMGELKQELKVTLTKDQVFILCDNRDEVVDSRSDKLGAVNMKEIRGKALFKIWPVSSIGGLD